MCADFSTPKILPCLELVCETCSYRILNRYAESVCQKYPEMPEDGTFSTNCTILDFYKENDKIKAQLNSLVQKLHANRKKIDELEGLMKNNGISKVKDFCRNIRMDIRENTAAKVSSIYRLEESLMVKVDEFEAECISGLDNVGIDDTNPFELINQFNNFYREWEIRLKKTRYSSDMLKNASRSLTQMYNEFVNELDRINKVIFSNKSCQFKPSEREVEEEILGAVIVVPMASELKLGLVIQTPEELHIQDMVVLDNGDLAACSLNSTWNLIWDVRTGIRKTNIGEHADSVSCLIMLKNGNLCSGSRDQTVKLWNSYSGELLGTFLGPSSVTALVILENGNICAGFSDGTINVWHTQYGELIESWKAHSVTLKGLGVLFDGRILSFDHYTIKIWRHYGVIEQKIYAFDMNTLVVANSGNVYIGSKDILVLDTSTGDYIGKWSGHTETVVALAVLKNGDLCSGYADGMVQVWDSKLGVVKRSFKAHESSIKIVRILSSGDICTCAHDNTIKVWQFSH